MQKNGKSKRLSVLHIATVNQPIKTDLGYGPIETVIHNIDKGIHLLGYRSIVACSGDSRVTGEHYVTVDESIGNYCKEETPMGQKIIDAHLSKVLEKIEIGDIDIIHCHDTKVAHHIHNSLPDIRIPIITTLHAPPPENNLIEKSCQRCSTASSSPIAFVPISRYQKKNDYPLLRTEEPIHHGIEVEDYTSKKFSKGDYLLSIGRITPVKGQDKAIEIAKRTGFKLIIAGNVQEKFEDRKFFKSLKKDIDIIVDVGKLPVDENYYLKVIRPLIESDKQTIYIGEVNSEQKKEWYRYAQATLFPIQWGEPFGLVMIESMACGTPIVALGNGAVPEIVVDGKTGFVVNSLDEMTDAISRLDNIDPNECRIHVERKFSVKSMARKYAELYEQVIENYRYGETYIDINDPITETPSFFLGKDAIK